MEESVGFEPTGLLHPSVFKTDALSQLDQLSACLTLNANRLLLTSELRL